MRRLLSFATLFASLLPLPSAAAEVFDFETAWKNGGEITLTEDVTLSNDDENGWTAGRDVTLTGSHKLILESREVGLTAGTLLYRNGGVSISDVTLQNKTKAYMIEATSLSLTGVTIASHSDTSATAAICSDLTLSGTLTLDLNSPCNTLLSCSGSLTYSTDFSGITINISDDFSLGSGGVTNLILFSGTAPSKVEELKCTVNGPSGYYVVLQKNLPGGTVLRLVPEPGSATLTLIALLALLHRRRRTRSKGTHGGAFVRG
ncbi:MAG: PEP-CTERM sorting domain-containing protein [Akkermansia muciniphila]